MIYVPTHQSIQGIYGFIHQIHCADNILATKWFIWFRMAACITQAFSHERVSRPPQYFLQCTPSTPCPSLTVSHNAPAQCLVRDEKGGERESEEGRKEERESHLTLTANANFGGHATAMEHPTATAAQGPACPPSPF